MSARLPELQDPASLAPSAHELARRALLAFLLTFMLARMLVLLIMARRIPNLYLFLHDTHVHHLNYGIFLLAGVGAYLLFGASTPRSRRGAAFAYGIAMALTFDEFGMWLHLGGSYWQRASVDAIVVVAGLLAFIAYARSIRVFEARHLRACVALAIAVLLFATVLYDASVHLAHVEGPRLRELELASSP
jgi:glucose dehydrogenase